MITSTRMSRCGAVALAGLTALSLAACGSSSTPSASSSPSSKPSTTGSSPSSSSSTSSNPSPAAGKDHVGGLVASVSGSAITLTGPNGPATVDVLPSTRVTQFAPGQLTDVTAGECLVVHPTKNSGPAPTVTAAAVLVGQTGGGHCGRPGAPQGHGITGTVASVSGSSIALTEADNSQATVTVTPDTRYSKRTTADASVIAAGQCLAARGTKDGSGTLQATSVNLRPSTNGQCGRRQGG